MTRPPEKTDRIEVHAESDPAEIARVRRAVEEFATASGFDAEACHDLGLCVNEAMANVIRHAYRGAAGRPIEVAAEQDGERVTVSVRDWGTGVDPESVAPTRQATIDPALPKTAARSRSGS